MSFASNPEPSQLSSHQISGSSESDPKIPLKMGPMVLAAGGSGGHVFPAIALAEYAHSKNHPVILMTDVRGARFIEKDRHLFSHIEILQQPRWDTVFSLYKHIKRLYIQWNPSAIIGFGGMMTLAPLMVAKQCRIRCGIHQSDAIMGRANRLLSPWMECTFLGYDLEKYSKKVSKSKKNQWCTIGTPTRSPFHSILPHVHLSKPLNILILGGSQGAKIWSCILPEAIGKLSAEDQSALTIRHQCPHGDIADLIQAYQKSHLSSFQVTPFFSDLSSELTWAHGVFSRAGASTLAELGLSQRAAFLVPYPHAAQNHQWANAKFYLQNHVGWVCDESDLTASHVATVLKSWLDKPEQLLYGEKYIKSPADLDACSRLYQFCTAP